MVTLQTLNSYLASTLKRFKESLIKTIDNHNDAIMEEW